MRGSLIWCLASLALIAAGVGMVRPATAPPDPVESFGVLRWDYHQPGTDYEFRLRHGSTFDYTATLRWRGQVVERRGALADEVAESLLIRTYKVWKPSKVAPIGPEFVNVVVNLGRYGRMREFTLQLNHPPDREAFQQIENTIVGRERQSLLRRLPAEGPAGRTD